MQHFAEGYKQHVAVDPCVAAPHRLTRVGTMVFLLHDINDIFLEVRCGTSHVSHTTGEPPAAKPLLMNFCVQSQAKRA